MDSYDEVCELMYEFEKVLENIYCPFKLNFKEFYDLLIDKNPIIYSIDSWKMGFERFIIWYDEELLEMYNIFENFIKNTELYDFYINPHDFNFYFYIQYARPFTKKFYSMTCPYV